MYSPTQPNILTTMFRLVVEIILPLFQNSKYQLQNWIEAPSEFVHDDLDVVVE